MNKDLSSFHKNRRTTDGHSNECKPCANKRASSWRQDNKEYNKEYKKNNAVKMAAYNKKYKEDNREHILETYRIYAKNNKAAINAKTAKRKAQKKNATVSWADKELIKDMYIEDKYQNMQVDHNIQLRSKKVCGLHWEGNMQLLTASDNKIKGNRHWEDM